MTSFSFLVETQLLFGSTSRLATELGAVQLAHFTIVLRGRRTIPSLGAFAAT
jgi:hypothetical protein